MKFDDEIVALQARVDALEARLTAAAVPEVQAITQPEELTDAYLESLTDGDLSALYVEGKIQPFQLGAAVAGRRVKANLLERIAVLEAAVAALPPEPETDPLTKTSGDDQNAGAWTEAGDGLGYPGDKAVS
jgi:hypothetical protein